MTENEDKNSVTKKSNPTFGMVRFTEWAAERVAAKRKRRGLGEIKPRKKHAFKQILTNGFCLSVASLLVAPLERSRILLQTAPMSTYSHELPGNTRGMLRYIIDKQGVNALWRGTMPHIYRQWAQVFIKITFYDRFKQAMMPYSPSKYSGVDFFIRTQSAAICCMGITTALTYQFDLLHTRLTADCTPLSRTRIYSSTFQCFNRTNIEEGRLGLFKGVEFAVASAVIRAMLQMPIYDMVKWSANKVGCDNMDTTVGSFTQRVGASLVSGMLLSCFLYPLDTFKRNSQLNGGIGYRKAFSNSYACTEYVFKESGGNLGLYRGCGTFFVAQVLCAFFQFSAFDAISSSLNSATAPKNKSTAATD